MTHDIVFDDATHTYLVDGLEVPSVTTILQPLSNRGYSNINPSVLDYARRRGTAVHEALEMIDLGGDPEITPEILPYITAYQEWCNIYKPTWVGVEQIVYNEQDSYIGTLDRIGYFNGDDKLLNIVDIKTSSPTRESIISACIQTYAYAKAYDPHGAIGQYALFLKPDGTWRFVDSFEYQKKYSFTSWVCWRGLLNVHQMIDELLATGKGKRNE